MSWSIHTVIFLHKNEAILSHDNIIEGGSSGNNYVLLTSAVFQRKRKKDSCK